MNTNTDTATLAVIEPRKDVISMGGKGFELKTLDDAWRFAVAVSKSGLAPKGIESPEAIVTCIQFGFELGLTPMAALQSIAVINGRPSIYGDTALGLCRQSGKMEKYSQVFTGDGETRKCIVTVTRKGEDPIEGSFSYADAKKAALWGKAGPWSQYPERMLLFRARGFALRDAFGDVLKGLRTVEEARDIPAEIVHETIAPTLGDGKQLPAPEPKAKREPKEKSSEPKPETAPVTAPATESAPGLTDAEKAKITAQETAAGQGDDSLVAKLKSMLDDQGVNDGEFIEACVASGALRKPQSFESITETLAAKLINAFTAIMKELAKIRAAKEEGK